MWLIYWPCYAFQLHSSTSQQHRRASRRNPANISTHPMKPLGILLGTRSSRLTHQRSIKVLWVHCDGWHHGLVMTRAWFGQVPPRESILVQGGQFVAGLLFIGLFRLMIERKAYCWQAKCVKKREVSMATEEKCTQNQAEDREVWKNIPCEYCGYTAYWTRKQNTEQVWYDERKYHVAHPSVCHTILVYCCTKYCYFVYSKYG